MLLYVVGRKARCRSVHLPSNLVTSIRLKSTQIILILCSMFLNSILYARESFWILRVS